ncbi:MAG TPA: GlxA family transcriptional regulator [Steroidobacteraceae bacterium]
MKTAPSERAFNRASPPPRGFPVLTAQPVRSPDTIGFLLAPRFSLMAFVCAVEPLRVANRLSQRELYRWETISLDGAPVVASNQMTVVADHSLRDRSSFAKVMVCAGFEPETLYDPAIAKWLRARDRAGTPLGAIDTGSFVLAYAGLLDGHRACTHWESLESLQSQFPSVTTEPGLFVVDRQRYTCAGGTAALDMMLHVVSMQHGHRLAAAVAEQFIHARMREAKEHQRMEPRERQGLNDPSLVKAIELMESRLEEPASIEQLCAAVKVSRRRLEREFQRQLKISPQRYYLDLRLQRARTLLQYTKLSVLEVGVATGFRSGAQFCRAYKSWAGVTPSRERQRIHQGIAPSLS